MNRLLGARCLMAGGEPDRARRLLTWHEAVRWGATNREEWVNRTLEPLARLERARLEEAGGLPGRAAEHYTAFLERFDRPVPGLDPLRREAAAGLARVSSEPTTPSAELEQETSALLVHVTDAGGGGHRRPRC